MAESADKNAPANGADQQNRIVTAEKAKVEACVAASTPTAPLTPEEQMALYENDLKENDWGHQPC